MRDYELTVLIHPDLEMNIEPATTKIKELVEKHGGKIATEENEGKKRLAYPIKNQDYAVYCFYNLQLPADAPKKIEGVLNITDEIIRYLLVSVDPRKIKYEEKQAARKPHDEEDKEGED